MATTSYTRAGCAILDATGVAIYADLVQFTEAALDRLAALLTANPATDWHGLLQILEAEAAMGLYALYYEIDDDLRRALDRHSMRASEAQIEARLARRLQALLTPQTYAALRARPHWSHRAHGPQLELRFTFDGAIWLLAPQQDGAWHIRYPGESEAFFLAYADADLRDSLLGALAEWRYRPEASRLD
ncbi:MAG TPA: hypothetical protein VGE07_12630 [Herpetosiphonaceae bacterium]